MSKRSFVYDDGGSHRKFWTVEQVSRFYVVTYGKLGTQGTSTVKEMRTPREAEAKATQMVKEKRGKGYVEVPAATQPGAPATMIARLRDGAPAPAVTVPASASGDETNERAIDV
jgi:predicted DNA-binding WGR domain protein